MEEYRTEFGFINFDFIVNEKYPNGLLLFMGSYIYKEFRNQGKFKEMVLNLFFNFPRETEVQVPLLDKKLVPMFEKMGFIKVKELEYWGECSNSIKMKGYLNFLNKSVTEVI